MIKQFKSAREMALQDIANETGIGGHFDHWPYIRYIVSRIHVDTKRTQRLNRQLGLHKINKCR